MIHNGTIFNDALTTAEDATNQTMSQLTGGFGIPGLF